MQGQSELRQLALRRRQAMARSEKLLADAAIVAILRQLSQYVSAKSVALFLPLQSEVDLELCIQLDMHVTNFYLPVVNNDNSLTFARYEPGDSLVSSRFGTREPHVHSDKTITAQDLGLIVMPCAAFDKNGARIGMGGGCYDRTLANLDVSTIAVAYETQRVDGIVSHSWDVKPSAVITNHGLI